MLPVSLEAPSRNQRRARVMAELSRCDYLGPIRDRAWQCSVPYSTLRRWIDADPRLAAKVARERRAPRPGG